MPTVHSTPVGGDQGLPKWFWGAVIGGGLVLMAAGAYVYVSSEVPAKKGAKSTPKRKANPKKTEKPANIKEKVLVENVGDDEEEEPTDPLQKALARKNKGNKFFKGERYEKAITCYTEAIEICPPQKKIDLATFYQNRAAAHEKLNSLEAVYNDCAKALELNGKYVKAMERRAKVCRAQAAKLPGPEAVKKLRESLEDITGVCILEGFSRQESIMLVDTIIKELGKTEATEVARTRQPTLASKHFIQQYFMSFAEDPVVSGLEKDEDGDADETNSKSGFARARRAFKEKRFEDIIPACTEEIESNGSFVMEARLLRGTFFILTRQQTKAIEDFDTVINDDAASPKLKVNALIKRASLYIQRCKDPIKDPELSFADFAKAQEIDSSNTDIYHHRGQVHLLTDQIDKAIADFSKSVEINPDFGIAYVQKIYTDYRKAVTQNDSNQVNNCINLFEQAMEKFPKCVETYALYAQVLGEQSKFDRAFEVYEQAQKIDPDNANLLVHQGLLKLQHQGNPEVAVQLIRRALEKDDKCEFALETLGTIEIQRGNPMAAIDLYDKAVMMSNTELEMAHLLGLKNAAAAQCAVSKRLGIDLNALGAGM